jgi:hypothetical protein
MISNAVIASRTTVNTGVLWLALPAPFLVELKKSCIDAVPIRIGKMAAHLPAKIATLRSLADYSIGASTVTLMATFDSGGALLSSASQEKNNQNSDNLVRILVEHRSTVKMAFGLSETDREHAAKRKPSQLNSLLYTTKSQFVLKPVRLKVLPDSSCVRHPIIVEDLQDC